MVPSLPLPPAPREAGWGLGGGGHSGPINGAAPRQGADPLPLRRDLVNSDRCVMWMLRDVVCTEDVVHDVWRELEGLTGYWTRGAQNTPPTAH